MLQTSPSADESILSPANQLRNILSMKSPPQMIPEDLTVSKKGPRPFKAYPKDPLIFPTMVGATGGIYGLHLGAVGSTALTGNTETIINQQSNQAYAEFRKQMLSQVHISSKSKRGGQRNSLMSQNGINSNSSGEGYLSPFDMSDIPGTNSSAEDSHSSSEREDSIIGGKRSNNSSLIGGKTEQQLKDEAYWERRRKNNEAAKRSRDARRAKEDEIAIRAAFLEQENLKLRFELCTLRNETAKLRCMLYNR